MATDAQNLQQALANIAAQLAAMTASPKPTYSVAGRSYSWGEHFRNLTAARQEIEQLLQRADSSGGAFEIRSRGVE